MKRMSVQAGGRRSSEDGSIMFMTVFSMATLFLFIGMCVDVAHVMMVRTQLQNAADAAALAAARELDSSGVGITQAADRATTISNTYEYKKYGVTIPRTNVTFSATLNGTYMSEADAKVTSVAPTIRFVKVTTQAASVGILFTSSVFGSSYGATASATAGFSKGINVIGDWFPIAVVEDDATPLTASTTPYVLTHYWESGSTARAPVHREFITLGLDNFGVVDKTLMAGGVGTYVSITATVSFNVSSAAAPATKNAILDGVNTRFDQYGGGAPSSTDYPPDKDVHVDTTSIHPYSEYKEGVSVTAPTNAPPGVEGRRLVFIPIVKKSKVNTSTKTLTFDRFVAVYLRKRAYDNGLPGTNIRAVLEAEYLSDSMIVGRGAYDPSAGGTSSFSLAVLYK
jgi:Flp pilus assembly protein TadG